MEESIKQFWEKGYTIFKSFVPPLLIEEILNYAKEKKLKEFVPIHDPKVKKGHENRFLSTLASKNQSLPKLQKILKAKIIDNVPSMQWKIEKWIILKSTVGGQIQCPHADYIFTETDEALDEEPTRIQASLIIGLMEKTKVSVYRSWFTSYKDTHKQELLLNAGDLLLFRGDLIHQGEIHESINFRVHCFLVCKGIKRTDNVLEIARKDRPRFKCVSCSRVRKNRKTVESHQKCCDKSEAVSNNSTVNVIPTRKRIYCEPCDQKFRSDNYKRHINLAPHKLKASKINTSTLLSSLADDASLKATSTENAKSKKLTSKSNGTIFSANHS